MFDRFVVTCLLICGTCFIMLACGKGQEVAAPATTSPTNNAASAHQEMCWGIWDVEINGDAGEVEAVPLRTADFSANVLRFLQPPISPVQLLTISLNLPECKLREGLVVMDITLRHPFPERKMFRGFDVRGIVMADGGVAGKHDPALLFRAPGQTELLNPDGYTRRWNQSEFLTYGTIFGYTEGHKAAPNYKSLATLNPYKLFTPSLDLSTPVYMQDLSQRATFPVVDGVFKRRYRMQFDATQQPMFKFKYGVDASWSLPNPAYAPNYPVEAFDSWANCQEAYYVAVKEYTEIPYYVDQWVAGGDLDFLLTIGDWQAKNGDVLSEISHVWIESPTLFELPIDVRNTMEFVESTHPTQATYRIFIEDMMPDGLFDQQMLITVESAYPNTYEPMIQGATTPFVWPSAPLAAYCLADVPITNLVPEGDYAYVYFLPDWCATMRYQCTWDEQGPGGSGSQNQLLMANFLKQNIEGYYNDYTHVQSWEGKTNTYDQNTDALRDTVQSLGYSWARTYNDYFNAAGSRAVIIIALNTQDQPPDPPFTYEEAVAMQEFIDNGGLLFIMCEASGYFADEGYDQLFEWLGMLMEYGGGAEPEYTDGYTWNITWHWLTDNVELYHYYTCGTWVTMDPHVLTLIQTETDQKLVLMYPLPL